jgi:hypothetical protein
VGAARLAGQMEPLWPLGLAVLVAGAGLLALPLQGKPRDQALWLVVGAALPAGALWLRAAAARRVLGYVSVAAAGVLAVLLRDPAVLVLGLLQAGLVLLLVRSEAAPPAAVLLGALAGWALALPVIFWTPAHTWLTRDAYDVTVALLGLYMVVSKLWRSELRNQAPLRWAHPAGMAAAVLFLGYACLHTDALFDLGSDYHWGFYAGPAQLIQQGAVPLWDVPSQYGLLSELAIAWLPTGSPWVSIYALNAAFNLAYGLTLFALLRAPRGDALDQVASLLLAFFLVFGRIALAPSAGGVALSPSFAGAQVYPSTGGLRFAWCLLLLLVAVRAAERARAGLGFDAQLAAGCGLWLLGCMWSFESAFYCCFTWLPAFALLAWPARRRLLAVPPALAAVAAAVVLGGLSLRLGHAPDPRGFYEYALTYAGGFGSLPIEPGGTVWALVLGFAMVVAAVAAGRGASWAGMAGLVAAGGLLWSTASYFVSRSHPSNMVNLSPMLVAALLLALRTPALAAAVMPRQMGGAVLTALLVGPLAWEVGMYHYVRVPPAPGGIVALRPRVAPSLQALIDQAGMRAGDPVVYVGSERAPGLMAVWRDAAGRQVTESPLWLPLAPTEELGLLAPPERRLVYLDRFSRSRRTGGWLVESDHPDFDVSWLDAWISQHYRAVDAFSGGGWRLTHYEPR